MYENVRDKSRENLKVKLEERKERRESSYISIRDTAINLSAVRVTLG